MAKFIAQFVGFVLLVMTVCPLEVRGAETALYRELVKKAKAEGEVEFWHAMSKKPARKVLKIFSKKFGIKAKFGFWRGVGRQQRTLIELKAGRTVSADLMAPGREAAQQFLDAGTFQKPPFDYLKVWPNIDKRQYHPGGWGLSATGNSRAIVYNPELVPPNLVPKTWDDCARPELKGKVVLDSRHKLYPLHWNKGKWFLGWLKKMRANEVKVIRGQTSVIQLVAAGAYAIHCSAQPYTVQRLIAKGAGTLKIAVPGELLVESATTSFIPKGARHPHAAQLLLGWLVSPEGQHVLDKADYRSFPWVEGTFNARLAKGNKVLFCGPECVAKAGKMAREYTKALGLPVTK